MWEFVLPLKKTLLNVLFGKNMYSHKYLKTELKVTDPEPTDYKSCWCRVECDLQLNKTTLANWKKKKKATMQQLLFQVTYIFPVILTCSVSIELWKSGWKLSLHIFSSGSVIMYLMGRWIRERRMWIHCFALLVCTLSFGYNTATSLFFHSRCPSALKRSRTTSRSGRVRTRWWRGFPRTRTPSRRKEAVSSLRKKNPAPATGADILVPVGSH